MASLYNFKRIQVVPGAKEFVDIVLSKTQRKTPTVIHKSYAIHRIRDFYMRKCKFAQQTFRDKLAQLTTDFPKLDVRRGRGREKASIVPPRPPRPAEPNADRRSRRCGSRPRSARPRCPGRPPVLRRPHERPLRPRPLQARPGTGERGLPPDRQHRQGLPAPAQVWRLALPLQAAEARLPRPVRDESTGQRGRRARSRIT